MFIVADLIPIDPDDFNTVSKTPREEFIARNGTNADATVDTSNEVPLSKPEAERIADAIDDITKDNYYLKEKLFRFYSNPPLFRARLELANTPIFENALLATVSGQTYVSPRLELGEPSTKYEMVYYKGNDKTPRYRPVFDPGDGLGTLLIHEIMHHSNYIMSDIKFEGDGVAYGIEFFFATLFKKEHRSREIMTISYPWNNSMQAQYLFCKWFLVMKWCYDAMQIHRDILTPDESKKLITDLIMKFGGSKDKYPISWAEDHLENDFHFTYGKLPVISGKAKPSKEEIFLYIRDTIVR